MLSGTRLLSVKLGKELIVTVAVGVVRGAVVIFWTQVLDVLDEFANMRVIDAARRVALLGSQHGTFYQKYSRGDMSCLV